MHVLQYVEHICKHLHLHLLHIHIHIHVHKTHIIFMLLFFLWCILMLVLPWGIHGPFSESLSYMEMLTISVSLIIIRGLVYQTWGTHASSTLFSSASPTLLHSLITYSMDFIRGHVSFDFPHKNTSSGSCNCMVTSLFTRKLKTLID